MPLTTATKAYRQLEPAKQQSILNAATEEFSSKGYAGASMNSLVRRAGISKGSLFQYFRSKQDLFLGLVELATGEVKSFLRQVREDSRDQELEQRLCTILGSGMSFIQEHPRLARIYFQLLQNSDGSLQREGVLGLEKRSRKFLHGILVQAQERGEIAANANLDNAAFVVNAVFERILRTSFLNTPVEDDTAVYATQEEVAALVEDLVHSLLHGILAEPAKQD